MLTIDVRLTVEEAIFLMRAVAAKQRTQPDAAVRDDLELLRLKLYDSTYPRQSEPTRIDRRQPRKFDVQCAHDPQQAYAPRQQKRSAQAWQSDTAVPPAAA